MQEETTPILVVGGGPVGLSTALFLGRLGVPSILVERRPTTSPLPRATGVHARSMELFRMAGIEQEVRSAGLRLVSPTGRTAAPNKDGRPEIPRIILRTRNLADLDNAVITESGEEFAADLSPCDPVWCGQDLLEPVIRAGAEKLGANVRFGLELVSFEQDDTGVTAVLADRDGVQRRIRAGWMVAADGVNSALREQLGIARTGHGLLEHMVSILFHADLEELTGGRRFILALVVGRLSGVAVCLDGKRRWMFWTGLESAATPEEFTPERSLEIVRQAIGSDSVPVELEGVFGWESAHRIAERFRSGRVFLAGDAAHTHPPHGGFGANSGMQDAHNLAWKLAAVHHGWAAEALLDTYEAERLPIGRAVADQALLRERFRATAHEQGGFRDFPNVIVGYRYTSAAVVDDGGPDSGVIPAELDLTGRPGTRVPHAWLNRSGERLSTQDLCSDTLVLLAGSEGNAWITAATEAAGHRPIRAYRIGPGGDLADPDGGWETSCRIGPTGAVLLRPDGFVAWRSTGAGTDPVGTLKAVLDRVLGQVPAPVLP